MKRTAYGKPILINRNKEILSLNKTHVLDEVVIQKLIFDHPHCLPISEIDESYNPVIPVCMELNTPAGPLDILMVTPNGELTIIETKLWRNPEARRVVVAQILDYAKELSKWKYEDLQREVNRNLSRKGNTLYEIAKNSDSQLIPPESDFVDAVSRNLSRGKFLLLIVGDGIREGAIGITEFLSGAGHLNFSFAMVELSIYTEESIGTLLIPKTIVKTLDIPKLTVEIPSGFTISKSDEFDSDGSGTSPTLSPEKERERNFYIKFWQEFVQELTFDDPGQPLPNPAKAQNLYVYPANTKKVWISAYFSKSTSGVGVYFSTRNDQEGHDITDTLEEYAEDIKEELADNLSWWQWNEIASCGTSMECQDIFDINNREILKNFFASKINLYVNVFRSRLKSIGL